MKPLREAVNDYLTMRRSMGYKVEGLTKLLLNFVSFCEARGVNKVQNEVALQWATTRMRVEVSDALFARRMDAVRIFAKHQHALDPSTQIPDETICNRRYRPRRPNVFTETEITRLLTATEILTPQFKAVTWRTLIGLLAVTGLRPGEACRLTVDDIDLNSNVIQVLDTKFGKSRLVFIHPSTAAVIDHYLQVRLDRIGHCPRACPMVFLNTRSGALNPDALGQVFKKVLAAADITSAAGHRPYRLHDLRHTFAVMTLLGWYRHGHDVQARLPLLSTWLGHIDPASTYWYLHAVPELLAHAAGRLEAHADTTDIRSRL